ncbi:MAG: hypothetical protein U0452_02375 [Anaerolineae bacterium]
MAKLIVLITAQPDSARDIGVAWKNAGAPGVTFLDGFGLQSLRQAAGSLEILSGTTSMLEILRQTTTSVVLVLSVVENEELVPRLMDVTQSIVGDMHQPDKGILFVLDVERALGVSSRPGP